MIVLGLILVLVAGGAIVLVSTEASTHVSTASLTLFGYTVLPNHLEMFLAGAVTAGVLLLGLAMIGSGSRRSVHRQRHHRQVRVAAHDKVAQLEDEKRRLEQKLEENEQETPAHTTYVPHQPPAATADDQLVAGAPERDPRRHP